MSTFWSLVISGAATGGIYAIMALGIVLTYETTGIFNFGHGAVAFASAFLFYELHTGAHLPIPVAGVLTILVFAPLLGLLLDRVMFRQLAGAPPYARIVGTIGLFVALPALGLWIVEVVNALGGNLPTTTDVVNTAGLGPFPAHSFHLLKGLVVDTDQLAILAAAAAAAFGLWLLIRHTRLGLLVRADVDRRELAALRGIPTGRVSAFTWVLTMVLASLGGVLLGPSFGLDNTQYTYIILGSFAAIVFAGLRSLPLGFAGGLLLGIVQNLVATYKTDFLPSFLTNIAGLQTSIPYILTIVGLILLVHRKSRAGGSVAKEPSPPDYRSDLPMWRRGLPWAVVTAAIVVYLLFFANAYWGSLFAQGLVFAVIFLSFVVVTGLGGMISLAQATFVTAGAFTCGWLLTHNYGDIPLISAHGHLNFALAVIGAGIVSMAAGALIAIPVRRLGALELALASLALAFIADLVVYQINSIRHQSTGYTVSPPIIGPFHLSNPATLSIVVLMLFGVLTLMVVNLQRSATGRAMLAARSSDVGARTSGISPDRAKVAVFAVAAGIAGIGGAFFTLTTSPYSNTTNPSIVGLIWLAVVVTFGIRRPAGALLAGLAYGLFQALFSQITGSSGALHTVLSSSNFLPILFGLGAINLAKNPEGTLAVSAQARFEKRQARAAAHAASARDTAAVAVTGSAGAAPDTNGSEIDPGVAGDDGNALLRIRDVRAAYGPLEVLHGVSLSVERGSITALVGSNGAGKSTLASVVAGLVPLTSGSVRVDENDITSWPTHRRASHGGIMLAPEARGVFPGLSVEDNLALWLRTKAHIADAYRHFPLLEERRSQKGGLLSGGEQQMLALASALVRPPVLLIVDEPTLGLAPLAAQQVCRTLGELRDRGTTILLLEERTSAVLQLADQVALMANGLVTWCGPRAELDDSVLAAAYLGAEPVAGRKPQSDPNLYPA